jgi:hypothetical protein
MPRHPDPDEHDDDAPHGRDPLKRLLFGIGGLLALGALLLVGRALLVQDPVAIAVAVPAPGEVQSTPLPVLEAAQHVAAAAQAGALAREEATRQARAQVEREGPASPQLAREATQVAVEAKERAWRSFYRPSTFCTDAAVRATAECTGELARARKAFEAQWAEGSLR